MSSHAEYPHLSVMAEERVDEAISKAEQYARDRVSAMMEESDEEDSLTGASPSKVAAMFSSSPHSLQQNSATAYDIDLDDEELPVSASTDHPAASVVSGGSKDDGSAAYDRLKNLFAKPAEALPLEAPIGRSAALGETSTTAKPPPSPSMSQDSEDDMPVRKPTVVSRHAVSSSPLYSKPATPRQARTPSPGLFVSPASSPRDRSSPRRHQAASDSDSDDMPDVLAPNPRLRQLIAQKKAERAVRESAARERLKEARMQETKKQKRLAEQYKDIYSSELNDGTTEEAQNALTENSRPSQRKASKKALEDMNRETQRMARNQQLAHQANVKRKLTTADFAATFNEQFGSSPKSNEAKTLPILESTDNEAEHHKTPPSSPPSIRPQKMADEEEDYLIRTGPVQKNTAFEQDEELPALNELLSQPRPRLDKGKGKAGEPKPSDIKSSKPVRASSRQVRVVLPVMAMESLEDDLEIVPPKKSRFPVFDRIPAGATKQSSSLLNLRALAHVRSPTQDQRKGRPSITAAELQMRLAREMQKQTAAEKQDKIEMLKVRGIYFKTDEEIEEDQMYVENMLEKARKEAMELGVKEREQAEKNGEEMDENYVLPSEDESNAEIEEDQEEEDEAEIELSGSEDEDAEGDDDGDDEVSETNGLFDDAAEDASEEEDQDMEDEIEENVLNDNATTVNDQDEDGTPAITKVRPSHRARKVILDDEEDDVEDETQCGQPSPDVSAASLYQTQTSPINAFGFAPPQASVGLTQMFQSSLADGHSQDDHVQASATVPNIDFLRNLPVSSLPGPSPTNPVQDFLIRDSQAVLATPARPRPSPSMATPAFTPANRAQAPITSQMSPTRYSEVPDPTPDAGFERLGAYMSNLPQSTVETVMMPVAESPIAQQKKGRLRNRANVVAVLSEDEQDDQESDADGVEDEPFELTTDAFEALFKASKKPLQAETFDKKHSKAKNMFEEQAEESEDEYAGLGGASDDDSDNGMDEELQQMIDEGPVDLKQGELAQFYADRDRAEDEKRVDKLYRDITTGALRKKRGANIDELSDDSDDEAAEKRRQKQREFAKMRRALLEDENVGKLAENPRKMAFFRAIEDRDEEGGVDYLDELLDDDTAIPESQLEGTQIQEAQDEDKTRIATTSTTSSADLKRKLPADFITAPPVRTDMSHRRRPAADNGFHAKPTSIIEIREQLSFLIDEPLVPNSQVEDLSDDDDDNAADEGPVIRRRNDGNGSAFGTVLSSVRASVINRLTLSRQNSLDTEEDSQSGPMAFHTSAASSTSSLFKIPSLLRRATTNMSTVSTTSETGANTSSTTTTITTTTNSNQENAVRRGGSKKSNIHFQAREAERMKKVQDVERRRKEGIRKSVVGKGRASVLGKSLGGLFSGFE